MSQQISTEDENSVQFQASKWIARIDSGEISDQELETFVEWVQRSPRHKREIRTQAAFWENLDGFRNIGTVESTAQSRPFGHRWPSIRKVFVAASVAVVVIVSGWATLQWAQDGPANANRFLLTSVGERSTTLLPDGSTIMLNTGSEVLVQYKKDSRDVRLQKGEALFEVTADENRPFQVIAGTSIVRAIGTTFSVRRKAGKIDIVVEEGKVQLLSLFTAADSQNGLRIERKRPITLATVSAGQRAILDSTIEVVETIDKTNVDKALAWRTGMLIFDGDSLEDVVRDVARYTHEELVISDPDLRNLRISGYFPTGETTVLLETLENSFNVTVTRSGSNQIYLTTKQDD